MEGLVNEKKSAGRRVLVTGATGIVGSWLTRFLVDRGHYVVALVRDADPQSEFFRSGTAQRVAIVNGSLEEYSTVARAINEHETDTVFHLGAQTIVGSALRLPLATFEANVRGTYNLLEACRAVRGLVHSVVVASSDKAYGDSQQLPYTEDMPLLGRHPYDVSKSCADLIAQAYTHTYELPIAIARCGNTYGGGDLNWSRIVPGTIRSASRNEHPVLRSDGTFVRDYIFVDDVVRAYVAVAEALHEGRCCGEAFNFSTGQRLSVVEIVNEILRIMGAEHLQPIIQNTARAEIRDQYLDCTKAARELGWSPKIRLEEGLSQTVDWYLAFFGQENVRA